ncbi:MAG: GNAT family N-acetyltransferase [Desulfobacterales bacterium]|nr:GNAT family N-acetyltransferase [Desulfobacterales bacterium]
MHQNQKKIVMPAEKGEVTICSFCSPDEIASLSFESFIKYAQYSPIISKKESLIKAASQPDANVTLALTGSGEIIGFCILEYPGPDERWLRVGDRVMMELSVVEVSRQWRSAGISSELLRLGLDHPFKEDRILYMVGYSWTWDLDSSGIPAMVYRDMMIGLFSKFEFDILQTNEPNIMLRPENLFMARIGANISEETSKLFKMVRFNLDL